MNAIKRRVEVLLHESHLAEQFIRGSGNGGQKVNKTSNCVLLTHTPTGIQVRCHKTRSQADNRRIARKWMIEKLDDHYNGELSLRNMKLQRAKIKLEMDKRDKLLKYGTTERKPYRKGPKPPFDPDVKK